MQNLVTQVEVDDALVNYALEIVRRTRQHDKLVLGVSPRGSQMLYRAAQAMAFLDGRSFCVPEDFKPLVIPVFAHRVAMQGMHASGMKKSVRPEDVIQDIIESVPVPV
jgi:MoxR-like ATPase